MKVLNLIAKTRSVRRYKQSEKVSTKTLRYIAEAARFTPSAGNRQRLRLLLVNDERCELIFNEIRFASMLDWNGPEEGQRPAAYIVVMTDEEPDINLSIDIGAAAQAMLMTATEEGLGGCMFRSFDREKLGKILGKEPYMPALVISLGTPDEVVILQDVRADGSLKYYRDNYGHHMVPKISSGTIVLK